MWGHLLPMTIVVLSHILSISPSAAAPQNFILPRVSDMMGRDERTYDEASASSSSWEESGEKNYPSLPSPANLIDSALLLNKGFPDDSDFIDDGTLRPKLTNLLEKPNTISSAFEHSMRIRPGQGLWNVMRQDGNFGDRLLRGLDQEQDGGSSNFRIHKPITESHASLETVPMTPLIRNEKRSPRCLRRCLAQGLLHPSQCHSLC